MNWCYQHNWSPAELQAVGYFARKSLSKLRRLQDVVSQQISLAPNRIRDLEKQEFIVWRLQQMERILGAAVNKKCFGTGIIPKLKTGLSVGEMNNGLNLRQVKSLV